MTITILQSGKLAQAANSTALAVTFSTSGGTGPATAGSTIVVMTVSDNSITSVVANGGGGATLTHRQNALGFVNTDAYDLVAAGGETGYTITNGAITGLVTFWWELAGVSSTPDNSGGAAPGSTSINAEPVGTATPTDNDVVLWASGVDAVRTYDTTSVGTFDGTVSSTQTTGIKVSGGAGHLLTSALAQSPTVHVTVAVGNSAGVIIAYKPAAVVAATSPPFQPLEMPPGLSSPMAFQFSRRQFPTINGWEPDSDRAGIGGLTAAPIAVRLVAVNWRSSASAASTVTGNRQATAALPALARAAAPAARAPQAASSASARARATTTQVRAPQPAAAPAGLGRTVPVMVATRAANVTAGSLARASATLGKLLPMSAAANSLARAVSTAIRAPQVATAASARARAATAPIRAPQPAAAAGGLGRDIIAPVTVRQATSSAGGRATATAFTGRVFLLASNLRAVGSTVASMLRTAQPAAAVAGIGRVTTAMTAARQALAAVGALGRTTTAPRRTTTAFGSLAARGGVGGSLGRGLVTSADVTAQGRIRALPVRAGQPAAVVRAVARLVTSPTAGRQTSATVTGLARTTASLHSGGAIVNHVAVDVQLVGHLDANPLRVMVESTADRSRVTAGPVPSGVIFRNPVTGAHRTR